MLGADVVVIGGGIAGCTAALAAARKGAELREGILEIEALEKEFGKTALDPALLVTRTVLEGALVDRRSRGCHYRVDAEEEVTVAHLPG